MLGAGIVWAGVERAVAQPATYVALPTLPQPNQALVFSRTHTVLWPSQTLWLLPPFARPLPSFGVVI